MGKEIFKKKGKVVVLTGDGEFQEGQVFEALQTAAHQKLNDLIVIMDHNKIQSSQYVKKINLLDLKKRLKVLVGMWKDVMDMILKKIDKVFEKFSNIKNKPKFLIADTIKGKGVGFMEHTKVMKFNKYYNWHAGAPSEVNYHKAKKLLIDKIEIFQKQFKFKKLKITKISPKVFKNNIEIH